MRRPGWKRGRPKFQGRQASIEWERLNHRALQQLDVGYTAGAIENLLDVYWHLRSQRHVAPNEPDTIVVFYNLGCALAELGRLQQAVRFIARAIRLGHAIFSDSDHRLASFHNGLGTVYERLGQRALALSANREALTIDQRCCDQEAVARDLNQLGTVYFSIHKYDWAHSHFEEALELMTTELGEHHPRVAPIRSNRDRARFRLRIDNNPR